MRRADLEPLHSPWAHRKASTRIKWSRSFLPIAVALLACTPETFADAVSNDFLPHGYCYLWNSKLLSLHMISDLLIGLSYVSISIMLWYIVRRFKRHLPFHWIYIGFGVFIVACGVTHFMDIVVLWFPYYWAAGTVKAVTAIASVGTAIALPSLVPKTVELIQTAKTPQNYGGTWKYQTESLRFAIES